MDVICYDVACVDTGLDTGCWEEVCEEVSSALLSCDAPDGYVSDDTDCDDEDADVYPGAPGLDDECAPLLDTGTVDSGWSDTGEVSPEDTGEEPPITGGDADDSGSGALFDGELKVTGEGCSCSTTPRSPVFAWVLPLLGLVGWRRRG